MDVSFAVQSSTLIRYLYFLFGPEVEDVGSLAYGIAVVVAEIHAGLVFNSVTVMTLFITTLPPY